jgi:hypothetical protein
MVGWGVEFRGPTPSNSLVTFQLELYHSSRRSLYFQPSWPLNNPLKKFTPSSYTPTPEINKRSMNFFKSLNTPDYKYY